MKLQKNIKKATWAYCCTTCGATGMARPQAELHDCNNYKGTMKNALDPGDPVDGIKANLRSNINTKTYEL